MGRVDSRCRVCRGGVLYVHMLFQQMIEAEYTEDELQLLWMTAESSML